MGRDPLIDAPKMSFGTALADVLIVHVSGAIEFVASITGPEVSLVC